MNYCVSSGAWNLISLTTFVYWVDHIYKGEEFIPGATWVLASVVLL
jgi:hypothetical protein